MQIRRINDSDIHLLKDFISRLGSAAESFRYFKSRTTDVIKNHLVTLLILEDGNAIAYGHLDIQEKNIWLGIAILPDYQGKGYGNIMMNELITFAKESKLKKIVLTVDNDNVNAIKLYEKFDFERESESEKYSKYALIL